MRRIFSTEVSQRKFRPGNTRSDALSIAPKGAKVILRMAITKTPFRALLVLLRLLISLSTTKFVCGRLII